MCALMLVQDGLGPPLSEKQVFAGCVQPPRRPLVVVTGLFEPLPTSYKRRVAKPSSIWTSPACGLAIVPGGIGAPYDDMCTGGIHLQCVLCVFAVLLKTSLDKRV